MATGRHGYQIERVMLRGEKTPQHLEVISNNDAYGYVIVHERNTGKFMSQHVHVHRCRGGWYESGTCEQKMHAEAVLMPRVGRSIRY